MSQSLPLQKEVLPIFRNLPLYGSWCLNELELVFVRVLEQTKYPVYMALFGDALDENDGAKDIIASLGHSIVEVSTTAATSIQVCFSSRP